MGPTNKTLLFCELDLNAEKGSWPKYSQWLSQAPTYGLQVKQARMFPEFPKQLEKADALVLCSPDCLHGDEVQALVKKQIYSGKRTLAVFAYESPDNHISTFWRGMGLEITNRGIYPLDPPSHSDHPQSVYVKEDAQANALAQALLAGCDAHEFSLTNRVRCTEDWSPAFELPREQYCDYLQGKDLMDFFPETTNPFFGASRCFGSPEPSLLFCTNPFMMDGVKSLGGYPTSGYRENRASSNRLLKWLAGNLSVVESRTERIRAMCFRFETLLHRAICRIMAEAFGELWMIKGAPESLIEKQKEAAKRNKDAPLNSHFHFVDYATIIRHQWDLFSSKWQWLSELSKAQLKRDFGSLNKNVRIPAAHPARLGESQIPEESERLLKCYLTRLKSADASR